MSTSDHAAGSRAAHELASTDDYIWATRVRWMHESQTPANCAVAYARNHAFSIGQQASFKEADEHLSAVEYLLGALGGDLLSGFHTQAKRRGVFLADLEVKLSGRLNNPLVFLGVVGETGHPGFETITGTLYVSSDAEASLIQEIWQVTLARSPLVNTLQRCVALSLDLKIVL